LRRLCALALCAPTKSDLQQRDIVIINAPSLRAEIGALLATGPLGQKWIESVPNLLIFCGNNRRQRQVHALRGRHFANAHLDAFFNAAVDAAIALSAFVKRRPKASASVRSAPCAITRTRCPDC
jgi:nitroreductase/FMN reductase [NAD(P)H]